MNPRINQLVKTLLQKESLDQCSLQELQQFADRHPYFGAAQLLLTKKMQAESPDRYDEQLQKTFMFFHNPLWVEHLLNDTGKAEIIAAPVEANGIHIISGTNPATETEEMPVHDEQAVAGTPAQPEITLQPAVEEIKEPVTIPKTETAAQAKEELLFEPFHTVDYFASQGIKLKQEEKPKDLFGQRLMSFTEWLRTMKRLPAGELEKQSEPVAEKKVEELAEHSLKEGDIVTEAMAEVWEKQGNRAKAIEIYGKLSLLEPAKSLYFAAKIEDLKKLN